MSTPFWFDDISILFNKNYLLEIIPLREYDFNRKLNAALRFTLYYGMLLYILNKDKNILCLPFITVVITVFIHKTNVKTKNDTAIIDSMNIKKNDTSIDGIITDINKDKYRLPDENNPMMNYNIFNSKDNKKAIPTYNNPSINSIVENKLTDNLPQDSNDLFNKRNSDRQWYTMPNTEIMNKQTEFAKWCYKTPPTCKEGNGIQCASNLHPRLNRHSGDAPAVTST